MSEEEVKIALFAEFLIWHEGQTYMADKDGNASYYQHDVVSFVAQVHRIATRQVSASGMPVD